MVELAAGRKVVLAVAMLLGLWIGSASALPSNTLWYNGDFNGVNASLSEKDSLGYDGIHSINQAITYDDFIVPAGPGWIVQEIWANDLVRFFDTDGTPPTAYWAIRSGVSAGNGGTLIADGTSACSFTATGGIFLGSYTEYLLDISGLDVPLAPGTYWLAIAPVDNFDTAFLVDTTSGANAVGMPQGNDGNSFFDYPDAGINFADYAAQFGGGPWDFSMGAAGVVPEPATLSLLGLGLTGLVAKLARRRNR